MGALPPSFAADAAVGAVACAGNRTGRVGDLGLGLVNGELGMVLRAAEVTALVCRAVLLSPFGASEGRADFGAGCASFLGVPLGSFGNRDEDFVCWSWAVAVFGVRTLGEPFASLDVGLEGLVETRLDGLFCEALLVADFPADELSLDLVSDSSGLLSFEVVAVTFDSFTVSWPG